MQIRRNKHHRRSTVGVPADLKSADKKRLDLFISGFEIRLKQEIEFLAPVLLADYKSAIVTHTAADCKSAETGVAETEGINPR